MATGGLWALLDDIATLMDDMAIMARSAGALKKTAGIIGDDLAVGAESVTSIATKRELSVVYKVAKGSARNKLFIIPAALGLSFATPWLIPPILMAGGAFLAYEAMHKVLHMFEKGHKEHDEQHHKDLQTAAIKSEEDFLKFEKKKINQAIFTDTILSAEIIMVALGTVATMPILTQAAVLAVVGAVTTVGVYGLIGGIVKLDDLGLAMKNKKGDDPLSKLTRGAGEFLLDACPIIMKGLSIGGTLAMFVVGGGLLAHGLPTLFSGFPALAHGIEGVIHAVEHAGSLATIGAEMAAGLVGGALTVIGYDKILKKPVEHLAGKIMQTFKKKPVEDALGKNASAPEVEPASKLAQTPALAQDFSGNAPKPAQVSDQTPATQGPDKKLAL